MVDDASSDGTWKILKKLSKKYENICCYNLVVNSGAAAARNEAMKRAKGQYVAFLDSDDVWLAEKLEKQVLILAKAEETFCYCAIEMIDENGKKLKNKRNIIKRVNYKTLLKNTCLLYTSRCV